MINSALSSASIVVLNTPRILPKPYTPLSFGLDPFAGVNEKRAIFCMGIGGSA